uniref:Plus3 domain-containing protein n=1 Tax=Caenorhabditis tropicalis TaxID=1561998 RepID=A0A1I7TAL2_9PELO
MSDKPLSYDSLKTVILYMEPNTKFLLSSRIPSIRTAEKAVPLKVNELELGIHFIRVNKIKYEYGVYQVDQKRKVLYKVSGYELNYDWTCNVDEFGIQDYITKAGGMLPGNDGSHQTNLFGEYDPEVIPTEKGRFQKLKERIEIEKQRLNQLINYRPKNNLALNKKEKISYDRSALVLYYLNRIYTNEELELLRSEADLKIIIEEKIKNIEQMKHKLLPFKNKINNIRPKFEIHIIAQQKDSKPRVIERVEYTGDLHNAEKSLLEFMFVKRRSITQVNNFVVCNGLFCSNQLPRNLKMRIEHLDAKGYFLSVLELIKPIMDDSSFPLKKLSVLNRFVRQQEKDHEVFKTAKFLVLDQFCSMFVFRNLVNQKIECRAYFNDFRRSGGFIVLIRYWVETNKPIGTCYNFVFKETNENFSSILQHLKYLIDGAVAGNSCVDIPMNNSSMLKVSYEWCDGKSSIKMEVVPR